MPTYQYACTACGHQLEAVQSFTEEPLTQCPACEGRLRKLFSSVGIVFKGSGFYRTDSRSDAKGSANQDGAASKDSSAAKDSTPAKESTSAKESKPAKEASSTGAGTSKPAGSAAA